MLKVAVFLLEYLRHFGRKPSFQSKKLFFIIIFIFKFFIHLELSCIVTSFLIKFDTSRGFWLLQCTALYFLLHFDQHRAELQPVCLQPAVPCPSLLTLLEPCYRQPNSSEGCGTKPLWTTSDSLFACSWTLHGDHGDSVCPGSWSLL